MPSTLGRHAIETLVDDAGLDITTTQWPLPRDAVQHALDALPAELPPELEAARAQVQRELRAQGGSQLTVLAREHGQALSGFGEDATPASSIVLRTPELDGPHLSLQFGGRVDAVDDAGQSGHANRLDGSALAVDVLGVQFQAWSHRSWWSPGWQNALPLGNNSPAFDALGFQRAEAVRSSSPWLSWLGPWSGEFWVGRSEGEPNDFVGANPLIGGMRLTFKPFPNLEIGLTRMLQWGGVGRSEGLHTFGNLILGRDTNADTTSAQAVDPGNELAGYDVRLRCPDGVRCSFYGQFIGEDEAGYLPTKFLDMLGAEVWSADGQDRLFLEAAETSCRERWKGSPIHGCAYRNYAFPGSYSNGNLWIGDSAGADARLLTFGWLHAPWQSTFKLNFGFIGSGIGEVARTSDPQTSGHLVGISARRPFEWGRFSITPQLDWNRLSTSTGVHSDVRGGIEFSTPLDDVATGASHELANSFASLGDSPAPSVLIAAGLIGGASLFDRAGNHFAIAHEHDPATRGVSHLGNALPLAEAGLAGAAWLEWRGTARGDVALESLESGIAATSMAELLKLAIDRAPPSEDRGASDFGSGKRSSASFPSAHTTLAWGLLTPIAKTYDAPWLYGVAALTNFSRVMSRDHWVSDTVAGALLGYTVGSWAFQHGSTSAQQSTQLILLPHGLGLASAF